MFSKELQIMDHNTATYMIDELQEQLDVANSKILEKDDTISSQADTISTQADTISSQAEEIMRLKQLLADKGITE